MNSVAFITADASMVTPGPTETGVRIELYQYSAVQL